MVDDEGPARRRLVRMLEALPGVRVCGEAADVAALDRALAQTAVDVVFLDIQMPGGDGVSWARARHGGPAVVFVTAYDAFAVEAFDADAADYVMKPVRRERLAATVQRLQGRLRLASAPEADLRIVTHTGGQTQIHDARSITRFWASQKYTLFLSGGEEHLLEETLASLEHRLAGAGFMRVHRSELIRLNAVSTLAAGDEGHVLELLDGQRARVSRRTLPAVREAINTPRRTAPPAPSPAPDTREERPPARRR